MHTLSPPWRIVLMGSWIMIAVLSVATLTLYVDNKRTRDCIAEYMVADNEATKARAELAEQERQAFKSTLVTIVNSPSKENRVAAIDAYVALIDKDDKLRAQNPIRSVPTECD